MGIQSQNLLLDGLIFHENRAMKCHSRLQSLHFAKQLKSTKLEQTSLLQTHQKNRQKTLVAFIFRVSHHVMIRYHQYKDEHAKEIGKEAEVLIVNHL